MKKILIYVFVLTVLSTTLSCSSDLKQCPVTSENQEVFVMFDMGPYVDEIMSYNSPSGCHSFFNGLPNTNQFTDKDEGNKSLDKNYLSILMTYSCGSDGTCLITNAYKAKHMAQKTGNMYTKSIRMDYTTFTPTIDLVEFRTACAGECPDRDCEDNGAVYVRTSFQAADMIITEDPLTSAPTLIFTLYPQFGGSEIVCCPNIALKNNSEK